MHRATQHGARVWFAIGMTPAVLVALPKASAGLEMQLRVEPASASVSSRSAWERVCDGALSDAERQQAADRVLEERPLALDKIAAEIRFPFAGKSGATYLVRAVERSEEPAAALFELVRARFEIADREELPVLLGAIGAFGTRDAVRVALSYVQEEGAVGTAALGAMVRSSGRDDLGSDRRAWTTWLERVRPLTDAEWSAELARGRGAQVQRLAQHERAIVTRLLESLRKAHIETPDGERASLLASYIRDTIPEIRELGFSLINRELGAGAALNGEVSKAALELLEHADVRTRASAALLVNQLSPPQAEERVLAALRREGEPAAASALMDAAARWASPELAPLMLVWLSGGEEPAWRSATNALWALARAGSLTSEQQRDALELLRQARDESLTNAACRFLGAVGDDSDRARLGRLLESTSPARRLAAAASLAPFEDFATDIVRAAGLDEELFPVAARATLLHRCTLAGYRALHDVAPARSEARREGLLLVAGALPATDLYEIASGCTNTDERVDLLEDLTSETRVMSERTIPQNLDAMIHGAIELAQLRLEGDRAEIALVLLDQFAAHASGAIRDQIGELQVAALLLMGRMELAEVLDAPASAWLLGLRVALRTPHAGEIASELEARYGATLTPEQRAELDHAKATIGSGAGSGRAESSLSPKR